MYEWEEQAAKEISPLRGKGLCGDQNGWSGHRPSLELGTVSKLACIHKVKDDGTSKTRIIVGLVEVRWHLSEHEYQGESSYLEPLTLLTWFEKQSKPKMSIAENLGRLPAEDWGLLGRRDPNDRPGRRFLPLPFEKGRTSVTLWRLASRRTRSSASRRCFSGLEVRP